MKVCYFSWLYCRTILFFYREIDKCEIMICLKCQKVKKFRENGMTNRQSVYNKKHYRSYSSGYSTLFCGVTKIEEVTIQDSYFLILYLKQSPATNFDKLLLRRCPFYHHLPAQSSLVFIPLRAPVFRYHGSYI